MPTDFVIFLNIRESKRSLISFAGEVRLSFVDPPHSYYLHSAINEDCASY
jgi:hypothetical protein